MKELEEIDYDFCFIVPFEALVELTLKRGLVATYDHKMKYIDIGPAKDVHFGMSQERLTGRFKEYSDFGASGDASLNFVRDDGYCFSLFCSGIDDYKVLQQESE
jgi:hypothetical protein